MCINCWNESEVTPVINERVLNCVPLIDAIYDNPRGGAGGYAHVVLDDDNIELVEGCLEDAVNDVFKDSWGISEDEAEDHEQMRQDCIKCLTAMKDMTYEERYTAIAIHRKYIDNKGNKI